MRILILLAVAVALSGCASLQTVMVSPDGGKVSNCEAFGFGLLGVPIAYSIVDECEKKSKAAGMVTMEEFAKNGGTLQAQPDNSGVFKIDTDPAGATIYSGDSKDSVNIKLGVAPFTLSHRKGINAWEKECYKATKDGFFDSSVECFERAPGDRIVKLTLAAKQ